MSNLKTTFKIIFDDKAILSLSEYNDIPLIIKKRTFDIKVNQRDVNYMYIDANDESDAIENFNDFNGTAFKKQF